MKYVKRSLTGITVNNKEISISFRRYLDNLCIENLSTLDGRIVAAKKKLDRTGLVPVYINEDIILFPTRSLREFDCVLINNLRVLSVSKTNTGCIVTFDDLTTIQITEKVSKILKMRQLCEELVIK